MKRWRGQWLALSCALGLVFAGSADAGRILVPVNGYLGDSGSWKQTGVLPVSEQAGWRVAGTWRSTPSGVRLEPAGTPAGEFAIDTVDLPSTAPLMEQARALGGMPGDQVVPSPSQDLRRVPALSGRADLQVVAGDHQLSRQDGLLLSQLVSKPAATTETGSK